MSPLRGRCGGRAEIAGCTKPPTAARPGRQVLDDQREHRRDGCQLDPSNPDIVYAAAYQRRRHVWTLIDGGPESAIYKSTDAGATWNKITSGLPNVDMGRIGAGDFAGRSQCDLRHDRSGRRQGRHIPFDRSAARAGSGATDSTSERCITREWSPIRRMRIAFM